MLKTFGLACLLLMSSASPGAAQENKTGVVSKSPIVAPALSKRTKVPVGSAANPVRATTAAPLTADECTTLGGNTVSESVCNSGKACETTTQNGEWKRVCLSKAQ